MVMKSGWGSVEKKAVRASSGKRPSKTALNIAPAPAGATSESISIRPIENGYIIEKSSYTKKGGYDCKQYFSAQKPKIEV